MSHDIDAFEWKRNQNAETQKRKTKLITVSAFVGMASIYCLVFNIFHGKFEISTRKTEPHYPMCGTATGLRFSNCGELQDKFFFFFFLSCLLLQKDIDENTRQ